MRSRGLLLAAILIVCVVGRGGYVLYLVHSNASVTTEGDTPTYLGPARELADHGRFDSATPAGRPEFLRTPGYPLFVAAVYRVFGQHDTAVLLVQVLLSALTVFLAYLLAARIWSVPIGLLAALFTALEPLQNSTSATLLTESLSALLLTLLAVIGFSAFRREPPRLGSWVSLGLVLAVATLVRPVTYYLPLFVGVLVLIRAARRRREWWDLAKVTAAFVLPLVVLVGGWQFRNHERVGSWRLSGIEAKNLYLFRAAGVIADRSGVPFAAAQHELRVGFGPIGRESQGSYYGRMYRSGIHILTAHPRDAILGALKGLWSELFSVRVKFFDYLGIGHASGVLDVVAVASMVAFYALFVYGLVLVIRRRRDLAAHAFVVGIALYVLLASAGPEAVGGRGERFRAPIMPILIVYAAGGARTLYASARESRRGRANEPSGQATVMAGSR